MRVSVVIPVYNEEDNIVPLAEQVLALLPRCPDLEVVFSDDGSTDGTWDRIRDCVTRHPAVTGLRSAENRGQTSAMLSGLHRARGDVLVTLDGDLQNNPEDIPALLKHLETCDAVCGYRAQRKDSWARRVGSRLGNTVRNWVTHDRIRDTGCSLKAFRRECLSDLPWLSGAHRFMPAYFKLNGRKVEEVPVDHRARQHGISKYTNLKRLPRTLLDLLGFWWYRKRHIRQGKVEEVGQA